MRSSFFAAFFCELQVAEVFRSGEKQKSHLRFLVASRTSTRGEFLIIGDAGTCPAISAPPPSNLKYEQVYVAKMVDVQADQSETLLFLHNPPSEFELESEFVPSSGFCKINQKNGELIIKGILNPQGVHSSACHKNIRFNAFYRPWCGELLERPARLTRPENL